MSTQRENAVIKKNLPEVSKVLHNLLSSLPAVRDHCSQEVVRRHLALIAYYQKQYDQLVALRSDQALPAQ